MTYQWVLSALADGGRAELSSLVKTCLVDLFFADITVSQVALVLNS